MSPVTFQQLLILGVAASLAAAAMLLALRRPWWATVAALVSIPALPVWLGASLGPFFVTAHLVLALLAIWAILADGRGFPRPTLLDACVAALPVVALMTYAAGVTSLNQAYTQFQWLVAYALGRLVLQRWERRQVWTVVALAFSVAAVLLLLEYVTSQNPWIAHLRVPNAQFAQWGVLQSRAGQVRAEGAFGHSIAAGACLAMAAVLTADARLPRWARLACTGLMGVAVLATLSRIAMVTTALGLCLVIVLARADIPRRLRVLMAVLLAAGGGFALARVWGIFSAAGDEGENSALYRTWILGLVPTLKPLGQASSYARDSAGSNSYGAYGSIDNAFLVVGLTNGWVPMLLLAALVVVAVVHVARGRSGVAGVALVAQIPAFFTVALITQYAAMVWMVAGMAVSEALLLSTSRARLPIPAIAPAAPAVTSPPPGGRLVTDVARPRPAPGPPIPSRPRRVLATHASPAPAPTSLGGLPC